MNLSALLPDENLPRHGGAVAVRATPIRHVGRPEAVGEVAAFLAAPPAAFITGQGQPVGGSM